MKLFTILSIAALSSSMAYASYSEEEISKKLIPNNASSATWESKCTLSMKGEVKVNDDKSFEMILKTYSTSNCEEGTDYLTLTRDGVYEFQEAQYESYNSNGSTYTYRTSPDQLNLDLSPVNVDFGSPVINSFANGLLDMYSGCIKGQATQGSKSEACLKSGVYKSKSRVRLSEVSFVTPTTMVGVFDNDITVEFNLKK